MKKYKDIFEKLFPIMIKPSTYSLNISLSKRFFLFEIMNKIINTIEEDPHLNFIALLKSYKVLGRFLYGTLHEFYRDRNKLYFKNFFLDRNLYRMVKEDLESLHPKYKDLKMTITKRGVIIYDNYKKGAFNVFLLTIHSGTWVQDSVMEKLTLSQRDRFIEEDIDTDKIYRNLVLENSGIWIDSKQSRFVIDLNRDFQRAIYADNSEEWLKVVWKHELTKKEQNEIFSSYKEFYFTLERIIDAYQFNIVFDAHSMKSLEGRPNFSFGTKYIPKFYMPVVKSMRRKLANIGYSPVLLNTPYSGGYILRWLSEKFPNIFVFSMEINKNQYMDDKMRKVYKRKINSLSKDLEKIFDIDIEDEANKQDIHKNP
ncbi:N-formylglutamate amidohydrolase [Candidatus Woesearchaeota archaeon]|nr:N-formylglutamate amidohydrolase [Candidatus Woesearchaeota archaeon]